MFKVGLGTSIQAVKHQNDQNESQEIKYYFEEDLKGKSIKEDNVLVSYG